MAKDLKKTVLNAWHKEHGGQMVEFGGWEMPVVYQKGIVEEHLNTRKNGGLFDVSHMGRFLIKGKGAIPFLQYVLTNNALALDPGMAQYTLIPNEKGGAVDDAYLYRVDEEGSSEATYLLVVNAANKEKDWDWLTGLKARFKDVDLEDQSEAIGMVALQGPLAKKVLGKILVEGLSPLPDPWRNRLRLCVIEGIRGSRDRIQEPAIRASRSASNFFHRRKKQSWSGKKFFRQEKELSRWDWEQGIP